MAADRRDEAADKRDRSADQRDHNAELRDGAAAQRDEAAAADEQPVGSTVSAEAVARSSTGREEAVRDRRRADVDRTAGAVERNEAERDRHSSLADRAASERERNAAAFDELTGVYRQEAGLAELDREVVRARRQRHPLVVAFIDVDEPKGDTDSHSHAAGDRMLAGIAAALLGSLRPYDVVLRHEGHEFLCVLSGLTLHDATTRFREINAVLTSAAAGGSVTVGVAELTAGDAVEDLLARAAADVYRDSALPSGDAARSSRPSRRQHERIPPAQSVSSEEVVVYQVSYTSAAKDTAHVTIATSLKDPAAKVTACGQSAHSWGDFLSSRMHAWPDQLEPWCHQCLRIASAVTAPAPAGR